MKSHPSIHDHDVDPVETQEWLESFQSAHLQDPKRALYLLQRIDQYAKECGLIGSSIPYSSYRNTIPLEQQGAYPGKISPSRNAWLPSAVGTHCLWLSGPTRLNSVSSGYYIFLPFVKTPLEQPSKLFSCEEMAAQAAWLPPLLLHE